MKVIPAIDLLNGQVVRLSQGDYAAVTHYDRTPVAVAKSYVAAGATRIHVVDLDGARSGTMPNWDAIAAIRAAVDVELEIGGGIRSADAVARYYDLGINYMVIGSMVVTHFLEFSQIAEQYPAQILAGLDAKNGLLARNGWTVTTGDAVTEMVSRLESLPIAGVIFTDIETDGMMTGPAIETLTQLVQFTRHGIIASGGIRNSTDISALSQIPGIAGCIVGKAILSGDVALQDLILAAGPRES